MGDSGRPIDEHLPGKGPGVVGRLARSFECRVDEKGIGLDFRPAEWGAPSAPATVSGRPEENVVNRPVEVLRGAVSATREWFAAIASQSERTILLGTVLLASAVSVATGFVLAQCYSVDVLSSLLFLPYDCISDLDVQVGRHCFSDATLPMSVGVRPNPWEPHPLLPKSGYAPFLNNYPAAAMVPHMTFWLLGNWLNAPRLGLFGYLLALTIAVLTPAVWAARGARGLERIVVFVACGVAAIPAWAAIDRGNSVGFVVPIALAFLVALCRGRWRLVAVLVVLAALLKPQFAVLAVVLFAARQWRLGGIAVAGVVISNVAAFALWPRDFPQTITQSIRNTVGYGSSFGTNVGDYNVSFAKGLFKILDGIKGRAAGGAVPEGFLAGPRSLIGYAVLMLVVVSVLALGRRIPPVMAGIVLLATASLFPAMTNRDYLVFVLPVAALVARDPDGPAGTGIFDRLATVGGRRRAVGICVSLATAVSIAEIALPSSPIQVPILGPEGATETFVSLVVTTAFLSPLFWLVACGAIIVSYARRPAPSRRSDQELARAVPPNTDVSTSSTPELMTEP
jgi:hypothetical protein